MFCNNCGSQIPDHAKFCANCGSVQQPDFPQPQPRKPEKKKKKLPKGLIIGISAVLVLAILAAVLIPILFSGKETIYVCVSETWYNASGSKTQYIVYDYDEAGQLLSIQHDEEATPITSEHPILGTVVDSYSYEFDGEFEARYEYEYDENGNMQQLEGLHSYGFAIDYEYDKDGRITSYEHSTLLPMSKADDSYERYTQTYECEYDDDGNLVRVFVPNGYDKNLDYVTQVYEYDDEGRLETSYHSSYDGTYRNDFKYKDGKLSQIDVYQTSTYVFQTNPDPEYVFYGSTEYEYDDDGNLTDEIYLDQHGVEVNRIEYEYDDDGLLEETVTHYDNERQINHTKYTCDEYGNVIEIEYSNGERVVYEYETRKVTKQQAAYFRRREGYRGLSYYDSLVLYHLIPDPRWEK